MAKHTKRSSRGAMLIGSLGLEHNEPSKRSKTGVLPPHSPQQCTEEAVLVHTHPSESSTTLARGDEWEEILRTYTALNVILTAMQQRRQIAMYSRVKDALERHTRASFGLEKLAQVLTIQPDAFHVNWATVKDTSGRPTTELILHLPVHEGDHHSHIESRRSLFESKCCSEKTRHSVPLTDMNTIPPKPVVPRVPRDKLIHGHLDAVQEVINHTHHGGDKLQQLRDTARARTHLLKQLDGPEMQDSTAADMHRLQSLTRLCDCVRSHFLHLGKTKQLLELAAKQLSRTMGGVPVKEVSERLRLLHKLVPQFCSIQSGESGGLAEVLTLNVREDYTKIRQLVQQAAAPREPSKAPRAGLQPPIYFI